MKSTKGMLYSSLIPLPWQMNIVEYAAYGSTMDLTFITGHPTGQDKPMSSAMIIVLGPLLSQVVTIPATVRAPAMVWIFGNMLIVNYFTSNLLSHITFPVADPIPRNFEALSARDDYVIEALASRGDIAEALFNRAKLPAYTKIRDRYKLTTN